MTRQEKIDRAAQHFANLLEKQFDRIESMKSTKDFINFQDLDTIIIGTAGGDGIGPFITDEAQRVLEYILKDDIESGKIELRKIDGLTIENRVEHMQAIPDDVLAELKKCHVILKGPTTTPQAGDPWPNIESANVAMRKELDLFANVRPVKIPEEGIEWIFFRENTEGAYALGSDGIEVSDELFVDFTVATYEGSYRILKAAFDYAKQSGLNKVTVVTKANVIKTTDGKFLDIAREVAKDYPEVEWDEWYIDIMTAKLIDPKRRADFKVFALPNLYGDILTDEAAEFQGGVGTAGSANLGKKYSMFEAIHGSAPRMVKEGRAQYADPSSMIRAVAMLLDHIGYKDESKKLEMALEICGQFEQKLVMTGRSTGATSAEFSDYILETLSSPELEDRYNFYMADKTNSLNL